ncbi:MAG: glycosyltransferase [Candidatus Sulfotelmatobacter sp.]
MKKTISVVIPAYNEDECVEELCSRLKKVFDQLTNYEFTAILVENGSSDRTFDLLRRINNEDSRFKILQLARNFRMDGGITAGLSVVESDALVLMTADLQDPPEVIPEFIEKWEQGYENVYGVVTRRRGTGPIRRMNSHIFYWVMGKLTGEFIPRNASDFRLLDRRVYEEVRKIEERNRFVRGLVAWVGFSSIGVEFVREERFAGESKAYTFPVIHLAVKGITAHSQVPLVLIPVIGFVIFAGSLLTLVGFSIDWLLFGVPFPGFGSIIAVILLMFSVLFLFMGILSLYIGSIYEEVKGRPNFIIRQAVGFSDSSPKANLSDPDDDGSPLSL